jgi:hypothetical protein
MRIAKQLFTFQEQSRKITLAMLTENFRLHKISE